MQHHVREFLEVYAWNRLAPRDAATGMPKPVLQHLRSLPLFGPVVSNMTYLQCLTRLRSHLASLMLDRCDTRDASAAQIRFLETQLYPLAVLLEAASSVLSVSPLFMKDALMTVLCGLQHKEI